MSHPALACGPAEGSDRLRPTSGWRCAPVLPRALGSSTTRDDVTMPAPDGLPYRVTSLATAMFARDTGFSGPELHSLFAQYTDALGPYQGWGGGGASRWQLFENGLSALSLEQQRALLFELCEHEGPIKHGMPSRDQIDKLRSLLLADGSPGATAAAENLVSLDDWTAVRKSWNAALAKVVDDPDGAITATRTTLESICKHICEERGTAYESSWDLARLYKTTATALDVAPDQYSEQIIKQILSGAITVVGGLAGMRNALSDAHGRGKRSAGPAPRHAKLAVNAGFAVAGFLIDTHVEKP